MNAANIDIEITNRDWIEKRYGAITVVNRSVLFPGQALFSAWVAAVQVMGGIAIGAGPTEDDALRYLRMDLSGQLRVVEIPL